MLVPIPLTLSSICLRDITTDCIPYVLPNAVSAEKDPGGEVS